MKTNEKITNYTQYIARMNRAMFDKLFFIDKVDTHVFVDFGCSEGDLLAIMKTILEKESVFQFIGYDIDQTMIEQAQKNHSGIMFSSDWNEILIQIKNKKSTLILSSVIHEIYHYLDAAQIDQFWNKVFHSGFDNIVIRDMIPSNTINRSSDLNEVLNVYQSANSSALDDFQKIWGTIENQKNLIHFLLKYHYIEPNWQREVKENYLPIYREELLSLIPNTYEILYHHHFVLPYIYQKVNKDIGIRIKDNTHLKLILTNGTSSL